MSTENSQNNCKIIIINIKQLKVKQLIKVKKFIKRQMEK